MAPAGRPGSGCEPSRQWRSARRLMPSKWRRPITQSPGASTSVRSPSQRGFCRLVFAHSSSASWHARPAACARGRPAGGERPAAVAPFNPVHPLHWRVSNEQQQAIFLERTDPPASLRSLGHEVCGLEGLKFRNDLLCTRDAVVVDQVVAVPAGPPPPIWTNHGQIARARAWMEIAHVEETCGLGHLIVSRQRPIQLLAGGSLAADPVAGHHGAGGGEASCRGCGHRTGPGPRKHAHP